LNIKLAGDNDSLADHNDDESFVREEQTTTNKKRRRSSGGWIEFDESGFKAAWHNQTADKSHREKMTTEM
jgi:hypothetical protein